MAYFNKVISFDPANVKSMTSKQKRDVYSEIEKRKNLAFKYTLFFVLGALAYAALREGIKLLVLMRDMEMADSASPVLFVLPFIVLLTGFIACMMIKPMILIHMLGLISLGVYTIYCGDWLIAPFSFAGLYFFMGLLEVMGMYSVLSKESGFPNFDDLSPDMINSTVISQNEEKQN